jgi:hypothetical protein
MTVTLKANKKSMIAEAIITESSKLSFNSLQAGMLVDAIVGAPATVISFLSALTSSDIRQNGLTVTFLSIFHGVIDFSSFSRIPMHDADWKSQYKEGSHVQARIVFVDQARSDFLILILPVSS